MLKSKNFSIKNNLKRIGVALATIMLFSLTTTQAMDDQLTDPHNKKNLYTRIAEHIYDPADTLDLDYLDTLGNDTNQIHWKKLFTPKSKKRSIPGIALFILAADVPRLDAALKQQSTANFCYSDEKKEKFVDHREKTHSLQRDEFINKHLKTSSASGLINLNDPLLHVWWKSPRIKEQSYDAIVFSPAHMAVNPFFICSSRTENGLLNPDYLPPQHMIPLESRLHVIDMLGAAGADFSGSPAIYRRHFLDETEAEENLYISRDPLTTARWCLNIQYSFTQSEFLMARALLHGADIKNHLLSLSYDNNIILLEKDKIKNSLLKLAFRQCLERKAPTRIYPTKDVKEELEKTKEELIKRFNDYIDTIRYDIKLFNPEIIKEMCKENTISFLIPLWEYHTPEEATAAFSNCLQQLEDLKF